MKKLHISRAISMLRSIPEDQAVHQIKSILTGQPITSEIEGDLFIIIEE